MSKHHYHRQEEDNTESITKLKTKSWWVKWISISGIATIAAVLIALPQIKEIVAYGQDLFTAPMVLQTFKTETTSAAKVVQGEIDTIRLHEYEDKAWKAKTDERLDNMEKMLTRILDNQEQQNRYNPTPKQTKEK